MKEVSIDQAIQECIELSRKELQNNHLLQGDIVRHDMFESELRVLHHTGQLVHVEFYNGNTEHVETAVLPLSELYYPDLAAGTLILYMES